MQSRPLTFALYLGASTMAMPATASPLVEETVYVETPVDTDLDGRLDRIYVEVARPDGSASLPTIYTISPYAMGGNDVPFHDVDVRGLPQDHQDHEATALALDSRRKARYELDESLRAIRAEAVA